MIVCAEDIAPTPWKNGGGTARDLLCSAADAADWRWRISLADIESDGPFSPYPGVRRWFAVAEGSGVELAFASGTTTLPAGSDPLAFDGASAPGCRLLGGPTRALNLLLHAGLGVRGVLLRAVPGTPWEGDWPLRGRFDTAARCLHWGLAAGALHTEAAGFWIGVAP